MRRVLLSRLKLLICLSLWSVGGTAWADWDARVVARVGPYGPFRAAPVQARLGEVAELTVVLLDPRGRVYANAESVAMRRRARDPRGSLPEGASVRWLRVEPRMGHRDLPPANEGNPRYSNTVLFGPDHGEWIGYDTLEYDTWPLTGTSPGLTIAGDRLHVTSARPTQALYDRHGEVGSVWYAAEVTLADGTVVRTPDGSDVERYGLHTDVQRVSFREDDSYVGWLGTYFNVPEVFGSAGSGSRHQTERYTGADCADVLVGALRASGRDDVGYTSVAGLRHIARAVSDDLFMGLDGLLRDAEGLPVALRWDEDIRPGDILAINFENDPDGILPRSWDHVGALVGDSGPAGVPNGQLDAADVLRHMGHRALADARLSTFGPIRIRVWRWRE